MPLSSAQIASMNMGYMQQHAGAMQYANMISQNGPAYANPNTTAENMAGAGLSRASAIGGPLAMGGLAMMGLDPLSIGVRSGAAAYGAGMGVGGAAMVGAAGAGVVGLGLAGASYMGGQMMTGAQQVQGFNQNMRGSFSFFNPGNMSGGGRGFGQQDIREIGNVVRSISGEGVGGQAVSFDELGRLATNMGRMGMAQGVRNAKEFGEKFREMLKTVKTVAEEMGTTLEQAQTTIAAMRNSGVFRRQDAVSQQIRSTSISGGLATTEVTGMMNIGSQISRMFGGTGRSGAMAGMKTIGDIGSAVQTGALSEEDIYNATGLTGAEGRQALATQQLQQAGSFLRTGKGRYFLASVAGKDGQLDSGSVGEWLAGGMDVGKTRGQAQRNLRGVGRANFIRNEGRLRGAAMEQFGGMLPTMALMQWAQGKGVDINDMDDRSMLFAQRQLGMGRDEMDAAVMMARRMPEILRQQRETREDDSFLREAGQRRSSQGIEGIKKSFEKAKQSVNNEMQKVGQDVMNAASDAVSRWANRLANTYEQHQIEGIREAYRAASMGGAGGERAIQNLLGKGMGISDPTLQGLASSSGIAGAPREDIGERRYSEKIRSLKFASRMGEIGELSGAGQAFASQNRDFLRTSYMNDISGMQGEDRISAIQRILKDKDPELYKQFRGMSEQDRAGFVAQLEKQIGVQEGARIGDSFRDPKLASLRGGSGRTESDFHRMRGGQMIGRDRGMGENAVRAGAATIGAGAMALGGAAFLGAGGLAARLVSGQGLGQSLRGAGGDIMEFMKTGVGFVDEVSGRAGEERGASQYLSSAEGRARIFGMLSGEQSAIESSQNEIMQLSARQARNEKLTKEETGRLKALGRGLVSADLQKAVTAAGGFDKMTDKDWDSLISSAQQQIKREGGDPSTVTRETVMNMYGGVSGAAQQERREIVKRLANQVRKTSLQSVEEYQAGGIAKLGPDGRLEISSKTAASLKTEGAKQALTLALEIEGMGKGLGGTDETAEADAALLEERAKKSGALFDRMSSMDVKSLRELAGAGAGTSVGGQAAEMLATGQRMHGRMRSSQRRLRDRSGKLAALDVTAQELGLNLTKEQMAGLKGLSAEEQAARIASMAGVGSDKKFIEGLEESIMAGTGQTGLKGKEASMRQGALLSRTLAQADPETRKKIMEAQGRGPDPMEKIAERIGEGNKYLEALVKSNTAAQNKLNEIAGNTAKQDPEKSS